MVEITGLVKQFGSHKVLDGIRLSVPKGQAYAVLGASGCGKSVLLRCILGLIEPDAIKSKGVAELSSV